jgi:hypothetical protein
MSSFNVNTNHPIIPNSQEYTIYKQYVSIHSEDRDIKKYPSSSMFEIELPQDYLNISSVRLYSWTFPANYNTFSALNSNVNMYFLINKPYNPGEYMFSNLLQETIFQALYYNKTNNYEIIIENGFYTPDQMTTELTNKFNASVTDVINKYFVDNGVAQSLIDQFNNNGGYQDFVIVYNTVGQQIWFGNRSSGFILNNTYNTSDDLVSATYLRCQQSSLPDFSNWGLPGYLGLERTPTESISTIDTVPRFYYGDVFSGDNGYWLTPNPSLPGAQVYYVQSYWKINLFGPAYMYMEIDGLNCIDETSPYNVSEFTLTTNKTNGIVNAAFAKIPVPTTPMSQWFDKESTPYKLFLPPAERIRKLKIKIRYHNGELVNFGVFNFSFMLEFSLYTSQQLKKYKLFQPNYGGVTAF